MPRLERAAAASLAVNLHHPLQVQRLDRRRYARRTSVDRICSRAGRLGGGALRTAREDPAAAGRVARPARVERPGDREASGCAAGRPSRSCRWSCGETAAAEPARRPANPATNATVTSCGPAVTGTRTRSRASTASPVSVGLSNSDSRSSRPPIVREIDALAVDRDLHVVRVLEAAHDVEIRAVQLGLEHVVAVERERVAHRGSADRAERKPVDVLVLREVLADAERVAAGADVGIADGQGRDLHRRRHVFFLQRRRDAEHVRDVVEAVGGVVGRQERGDVDVEVEQVAHRVRVLAAVQAVQDRRAGIRMRGRLGVELRLRAPPAAAWYVASSGRAHPAAAWRAPAACARLSPRAPGSPRPGRRRGPRATDRRSSDAGCDS